MHTQSRKCLNVNAYWSLSVLCIHSQVHVCAFGLFTFAHVQKQKGCSGTKKKAREFTALAFADQRTIVHCLRAHKQQAPCLSLLSPSHQRKRAHLYTTIIKQAACQRRQLTEDEWERIREFALQLIKQSAPSRKLQNNLKLTVLDDNAMSQDANSLKSITLLTLLTQHNRVWHHLQHSQV